MHSGLNYEKMSPVEKMMMKMFKKMLVFFAAAVLVAPAGVSGFEIVRFPA